MLLVADSAKDCQEGNPAEPSEREAPGYPFTGRGLPKDPLE